MGWTKRDQGRENTRGKLNPMREIPHHATVTTSTGVRQIARKSPSRRTRDDARVALADDDEDFEIVGATREGSADESRRREIERVGARIIRASRARVRRLDEEELEVSDAHPRVGRSLAERRTHDE
jgi:hypothetical protein